jgi:hypothetical protein
VSTIRGYLTASYTQTLVALRDGWADWYEEFGRRGVYLATRPLDANDGFAGDVTLCLDVPAILFTRFEVTDEVQEAGGYRMALIPAADLNAIGRGQVYSHTYLGLSRRDLVRAIAGCKESSQSGVISGFEERRQVNEMKEAMGLFDLIGWTKPLELKVRPDSYKDRRQRPAKDAQEGP